jgi:hypothetical protein
MPRRTRRAPRALPAVRPPAPTLPDGTLDPREWERASKAAIALILGGLHDEPWFVSARPVETLGVEAGIELDVVVLWDSSDVRRKIPLAKRGFLVNVTVEGQTAELCPIH